jgi:hypothetical protein
MNTKLSTTVANRLKAALLKGELVSSEIRYITGWDDPKMSIKIAVASFAKRAGLRLKLSKVAMESGPTMIGYCCTKPAAAALKTKAAPRKRAAAKKASR